MDNMDNPNQGNPERLIHGTTTNLDEDKKHDEKDHVTDDNPLPENKDGRSEADKEAQSHPEDFKSFDVDKVDNLEKTKEESDEPQE